MEVVLLEDVKALGKKGQPRGIRTGKALKPCFHEHFSDRIPIGQTHGASWTQQADKKNLFFLKKDLLFLKSMVL